MMYGGTRLAAGSSLELFHFGCCAVFISLTADGPRRTTLSSCLWSLRISPSLPGSRLTFFCRNASSALPLQLVNQWLDFTYSRSHDFRSGRKNTNPTLTVPCSGFVFSAYIFDDVLLLFFWCPCMSINNVGVQYNDGLLPVMIVLTQCYYYHHRRTRLNAIKRFVFAAYDPT